MSLPSAARPLRSTAPSLSVTDDPGANQLDLTEVERAVVAPVGLHRFARSGWLTPSRAAISVFGTPSSSKCLSNTSRSHPYTAPPPTNGRRIMENESRRRAQLTTPASDSGIEIVYNSIIDSVHFISDHR